MATIDQKLTSPNIRVYFCEVLAGASLLQTRKERVELLRRFRDKSAENATIVAQFMECMYHPDVRMEIPEGVPPIQDTGIKDFAGSPLPLTKSFAKVKYFVPSHSAYIQATAKRENVFIQTLEQMYESDAKLFCMIKDKKIDSTVYPGITDAVLKAAFSDEEESVGNE